MRNQMAQIRAVFIAIVFGIVGGCGGGGGGGGQPGNENTTITGVVRNSTDGDRPVEGATVTIGGKTAVTTTIAQTTVDNETGSFRITGVATGTNTAVVTAPGIGTQTIGLFPAVAVGANTYTLTLNIGQVSGRILRQDGAAANGAFVTLAATGDNTVANENGEFFFSDIPSGATEITAVLGTATARVNINVVNGLNVVPNIGLVDDPNAVNPPGLPLTIAGHIAIAGQNIAGAGSTIELYRNNVLVERQTANATGDYGFYVPTGRYGVRILLSGYREATGMIDVVNPSVPVQADFALLPQ